MALTMYHWIFFTCTFIVMRTGMGRIADGAPPTLQVLNKWEIPANTPNGSFVIQAKVFGAQDPDRLRFDLESESWKNSANVTIPFRIDPSTGEVFVNGTLKDKIGNMFIYVAVSDGPVTIKNEVWVQILNKTTRQNSNSNHPPFLRPHNSNLGLHPFTGFRPMAIPNVPHQPSQMYPVISTTTLTTTPPIITTDKTKPSMIDNNNATNEVHSNQLETVGVFNHTNIRTETPVKTSSSSDLAVTLALVVFVCAIFIMIGTVLLVYKKKFNFSKVKSKKDDVKEPSVSVVLQGEPGLVLREWRGPRAFSNRYESWDRDTQPQPEKPVGDSWEFPRHRLKVFDILGEGAFGQVWRCEATDIGGKEGVSIVAVKTLKENASEKERSDLNSELTVLKVLEPHPNVVRLLGCCSDKQPLLVIMEFVAKGKLQTFLRDHRAERGYTGGDGPTANQLTARDLTSFVYQVARGMEYVSSKGIVHRDLAARNVLITDELTCKVADFGFARVVGTQHGSGDGVYERKSEGRLPIRWMAPESLYDNIFTVKSDVWSFGVFMWEVVTLGSTPYPGITAAEVMRKVRDGHRLEKPEHCRRELYNIMYYCWDKEPKDRPTFAECVALLEKLLLSESDYIELERFPDHSYYNMASLSGEKL